MLDDYQHLCDLVCQILTPLFVALSSQPNDGKRDQLERLRDGIASDISRLGLKNASDH